MIRIQLELLLALFTLNNHFLTPLPQLHPVRPGHRTVTQSIHKYQVTDGGLHCNLSHSLLQSPCPGASPHNPVGWRRCAVLFSPAERTF
jgi:hypothetical protein